MKNVTVLYGRIEPNVLAWGPALADNQTEAGIGETLVFSANPENSPAIPALSHAELPVKLVSAGVLDSRNARTFGLAKVNDVQAVADFHRGKRVLEALAAEFCDRGSFEREHGYLGWLFASGESTDEGLA